MSSGPIWTGFSPISPKFDLLRGINMGVGLLLVYKKWIGTFYNNKVSREVFSDYFSQRLCPYGFLTGIFTRSCSVVVWHNLFQKWGWVFDTFTVFEKLNPVESWSQSYYRKNKVFGKVFSIRLLGDRFFRLGGCTQYPRAWFKRFYSFSERLATQSTRFSEPKFGFFQFFGTFSREMPLKKYF